MNLFYALAAQSETSFWEDVWNYLYDVYLRVDGNYQNLGFEKMPLFSLRLTVLGIFLGMIVGCLAMAYHKQVIGGVVRKLIADGCNSADSAKTAAELGYLKNPLAKNALRGSVALRRVVRCAEEEKFYRDQAAEKEAYEEKRQQEPKLPKFKEREYLTEIATDRFYIPEELRIRAEIKFEKKGSGWISGVLGILCLLVIFFCLLLVLPHILQITDNFMGGL